MLDSNLAISVPADASEAASVRQAFTTIRQKLGNHIDVLLYNAGAYTYGTSTNCSSIL